MSKLLINCSFNHDFNKENRLYEPHYALIIEVDADTKDLVPFIQVQLALNGFANPKVKSFTAQNI